MKRCSKIISLFVVLFLLSALTGRSEVASNSLDLVAGTIVMGDIYQGDIYGEYNFSVYRNWHDPFYDLDVVDMGMDFLHYPPYNPLFNVTTEIVKSLVVIDNRTMAIPVFYYYMNTTEYDITIFIDIQDDLNITSDDLKVTFNGTTYIYDDVTEATPGYEIISQWMLSFGLGNMLLQQLMPLTPYAISPLATIGQTIEYGSYNGTVMGYTNYYISETEYYEAIEVHHDEVVVHVDMLGSDSPQTIGDRTLLYEKNTGIILHWLEYNSSADKYYYFNATDVIGLSPIIVVPEFSGYSLVIISSIVIAIPIFLVKRKKK